MTNVALRKRVLEADVKNGPVATDGQVAGYSTSTGYASFLLPGTLTVDLGAVYQLWCVRFLLWDADPRVYKYRFLTSTTALDWELQYDSSDQGKRGWQVFDFERRIQARYVRIEGLSNSVSNNRHFHVVEIEAHDDTPPDLEVRPGFVHAITPRASSEPVQKPFWLAEFAVPATVGVLAAVVGAIITILPSLFGPRSEISYAVEGPTNYLSDPAMANVQVTVDGELVNALWGFKVRVWNSGNKPIEHLPAQLVFTPPTASFSILRINHSTRPAHEFGTISDETPGPNLRRFVYALLNPNDEDLVSVLTNEPARLEFYAKAPGVTVSESRVESGLAEYSASYYLAVVAGVFSLVGALSSLLSLGLSRYLRERIVDRLIRTKRL